MERVCEFFGERTEGYRQLKLGTATYDIRGARRVPTTKLLSPLTEKCVVEQIKDKLSSRADSSIQMRSFCHECRQDVSLIAEPVSKEGSVITWWR